ncbi:MAG: hypothetical protein FJ272_05855, partial [Planctomycetes bacterium]|nr:hypothetical protein [Planctomycetota bacterium]
MTPTYVVWASLACWLVVLCVSLGAAEREIGLAACWQFEDIGSGLAKDDMAQNHGAIKNANRVCGKAGNGFALSFDGDGGCVEVADHSTLQLKGALTVECWVKLRRASGDVVCKNSRFLLRVGGAFTPSVWVGGAWRKLEGRIPVEEQRWYHLAVTYDPQDKTIRSYVNGVKDTEEALKGLADYSLGPGAGQPLVFGKNTWGTWNYLDGVVDEVKIWSVAKTFTPLPPRPPDGPPPEAREGVNLLENGSFEFGLQGWRSNGERCTDLEWEIDESVAHSGKRSLRSAVKVDDPALDAQRSRNGVIPTAPCDQIGILSRPVPVSKGRAYTLSAWLRTDGDTKGASLMLHPCRLAGKKQASGFSKSLQVSREWQRCVFTREIPADWPADKFFALIGTSGPGRLWVDDAQLVLGAEARVALAKAEMIGLELQTGRAGNTYLRGEPAELLVHAVNMDSVGREFVVTHSLTDSWGEPVANGQWRFELAAGERKTERMRLDSGRTGAFTASFAISDKANAVEKPCAIQFLVVPTPRADVQPDDSPFGMNTHSEREPTPHLDRNYEMLARCGVKWVRLWWGWCMAEREPGKWDWAEFDRQLSLAEKHKLSPLVVLMRYYSDDRQWTGKVDLTTPAGLEKFASYVFQTVSRYKGRVRHWEMWNEPVYGGGKEPPEEWIRNPSQYA